MEIISQSNNQLKSASTKKFDKKSRENYFEMLKVALENLSIVYDHERDRHPLNGS
jgi:hypothetical protein